MGRLRLPGAATSPTLGSTEFGACDAGYGTRGSWKENHIAVWSNYRRLVLATAAAAILGAPAAAEAAFPGANGKIAYSRPGASGFGTDIYVMNPDGSNQTPIATNGAGPAWSPDGTKIAFTRADIEIGSEILVVNADGSGEAPLTNDGSDPSWSPSGEIAFVRSVSGQYDVFKMNADQTGTPTNLTLGSAFHDADPHWSPDGSKIVFSTDREGASGVFDLYTLNPNQANPVAAPIAGSDADWESFGAWSPDSASLAFQLSPTAFGGVFDIWMLPGGGGAAVNLTQTANNDEQGLTWSPDGKRLAFGRNTDGATDVWTMNPDGSGQTQLTFNGTGNTPDWQQVQAPVPPPTVTQPALRAPLKLADLSAPDLGREVNVEPVSGQVLVALPAGTARSGARAAQKGLRFVPLSEARQIPTGSFLDTSKGTVRLQSSVNSRGKAQFGNFASGLFQVLQSRKRSAKGLTDVVLKGSSFSRCGSARRGKRSARTALSRSTRRRLRANARGRFRTRGRHSAATVRGTVWLTADRCDGTLTKVTRGKVAVRDFRRKKTVLVRAGKSYLAKAPR